MADGNEHGADDRFERERVNFGPRNTPLVISDPFSDSHNRVCVRERTLPEVTVTQALIDRATKSFHAILNGVEALGIPFRKAQGSYDSGYFQKSHD